MAPCLAHNGEGHKLGKGSVLTDPRCGRREVSVPAGEPLHWPRWEDQGWAAQLREQGGADTGMPCGLCPPGLGQ